MIKKAIFIFCSLLFCGLFSFAQSKKEIRKRIQIRDKYLFSVQPPSGKFSDTLPFSYNKGSNEIIIPVRINGETYNFIFDTGAPVIISNELKAKLKLSAAASLPTADGANNTRKEDIYLIDGITIGTTTFQKVGAIASDLTKFNHVLCTRIDGIIGANLLRTCYWRIDFKHRTLYFSSHRIRLKDADLVLEFKDNFSGSPLIPMHLGKFNFQAIWDSGDAGYLRVADSLFFNSGAMQEKKLARGQGVTTLTLYRKNIQTKYLATVDSIYFDGELFTNEPLAILPEKSLIASVGNKFMSQFQTMILDWKHHKIYLDHQAAHRDSSLTRGFGVQMFVDSGVCRVAFLWDHSQAQQQGIQLWDTVVAINGQPVTSISDAAWCRIRTAIPQHHTLQVTISEGKATRQYIFEKHPLLQ